MKRILLITLSIIFSISSASSATPNLEGSTWVSKNYFGGKLSSFDNILPIKFLFVASGLIIDSVC